MFFVSNPRYQISFDQLGVSHPFQLDRSTEATALFEEYLNSQGFVTADSLVSPRSLISFNDLSVVHSEAYLREITNSSKAIADAFDMPGLAGVSLFQLYKVIMCPLLLATQGVVDGARLAVTNKTDVVTAAGGFHHAFAERGGGFCVVNDIAVAIRVLRRDGILREDQSILYIDLDAHLGNGVAGVFWSDPSIKMLDIHNRFAYPSWHTDAPRVSRRIDFCLPISPQTGDDEYLKLLSENLAELLATTSSGEPPALAFFNAGTDVLSGDRLGGLGLSKEGVNERDRLVLDSLQAAGIPVLLTPSGGYNDSSAQLLADAAIYLHQRESRKS